MSIYEFPPLPVLKKHWNSGLSAPAWVHWREKFFEGTFLLPPKADAQIVYILAPVLFLLCRLPHCSLRHVIYGKQWISQYTVCLQNMFWLTFHWSQLSLWLPAKIVAVHFGCLPVWIYGGVSLSEDCWLVWVAATYCWVFCPVISVLHFVQVLSLCPKSRDSWRWRNMSGEGESTGVRKLISFQSCTPAVCIMCNKCV